MTQLGLSFVPKADAARLGKQQAAVERLMLGNPGMWFDLWEISAATGAPVQSASARIRTMRQRGHRVDRESRGGGLHVYRYVPEEVPS